ncbi:MAG: pyridoxal phosphate-dependent aminotransferase [Vicinamibacterales bacterium]
MLADRLSHVTGSATLAVAAEADRLRRAGVDVVDLGAGEPDFDTPAHVKAAGIRAIEENFTRYTPAAGILELREAVCARYRSDYGVRITPEEILITAGGKQSLFNAALALFDPGDEVITHAPCWPTIPEQIKIAGATPVLVRTHAEDRFELHAGRMIDAITPRTKAIVLNSPANPTGALISEAATRAIAGAAASRGIWIIVDLCYERLIYDRVPHNLVGILLDCHRDRTVLCGSASKAYAMTGWRCGWTVAPPPLVAACNTIQGHSTSNIASITQKAAMAALTGPQEPVTRMLDEYRERRDRVHAWVTEHPGIRCLKPAGAFYLLLDISEVLSPGGIRTSVQFAQALLEQARVAVTPGEAFDAPGHIRISYATSLEQLRDGATRILKFAESVSRVGTR